MSSWAIVSHSCSPRALDLKQTPLVWNPGWEVVAHGGVGMGIDEKPLFPEMEELLFQWVSLQCVCSHCFCSLFSWGSKTCTHWSLGLWQGSLLPKEKPCRNAERSMDLWAPHEVFRAQKPPWFWKKSALCLFWWVEVLEPTRKHSFDPQEGSHCEAGLGLIKVKIFVF